jgi:predicted nucleotidyltransferase
MGIALDERSCHRIVAWAAGNDCVREIWLFGSRARGNSRPDSDIDLAIVLMPSSQGTDWAFGTYQSKGDEWQRELTAMLDQHVSLEAIIPGTHEYDLVTRDGYRLWVRSVVGPVPGIRRPRK